MTSICICGGFLQIQKQVSVVLNGEGRGGGSVWQILDWKLKKIAVLTHIVDLEQLWGRLARESLQMHDLVSGKQWSMVFECFIIIIFYFFPFSCDVHSSHNKVCSIKWCWVHRVPLTAPVHWPLSHSHSSYTKIFSLSSSAEELWVFLTFWMEEHYQLVEMASFD